MSGVADRIRTRRPRTPTLPGHLAALVGRNRFARDLAIAAAPPWWSWRPRGLAPLRAGGPADRPAHVDPTRPTTIPAFPGGDVPGDIPA